MQVLVNLSYLAGIEVWRGFGIGGHERQFTESELEYQLLEKTGVVVEVIFDEAGDEVIAVIIAGLHTNI